MVYRKENGVIVPYANNSGQNVAADINIIDKNGKVVSAGGTTNIQALVSKISDDTVELSSDLASIKSGQATVSFTSGNGALSLAGYRKNDPVVCMADQLTAVIIVIKEASSTNDSCALFAANYDGSAYTGDLKIVYFAKVSG